MRRKHHLGLFCADGGGHLFGRTGSPGGLRAIALTARLADHGATAQAGVGIKNLAPAEAEPAIAHDEHLFLVGKLARHSLHAKGAATGHQHGGVGVVDLFEHGQNVLHHAREALGHMVECAVGVDHREFEQAIGIDIGQQSGHVNLSINRNATPARGGLDGSA